MKLLNCFKYKEITKGFNIILITNEVETKIYLEKINSKNLYLLWTVGKNTLDRRKLIEHSKLLLKILQEEDKLPNIWNE